MLEAKEIKVNRKDYDWIWQNKFLEIISVLEEE